MNEDLPVAAQPWRDMPVGQLRPNRKHVERRMLTCYSAFVASLR
jgi:hypothetical protein